MRAVSVEPRSVARLRLAGLLRPVKVLSHLAKPCRISNSHGRCVREAERHAVDGAHARSARSGLIPDARIGWRGDLVDVATVRCGIDDFVADRPAAVFRRALTISLTTTAVPRRPRRLGSPLRAILEGCAEETAIAIAVARTDWRSEPASASEPAKVKSISDTDLVRLVVTGRNALVENVFATVFCPRQGAVTGARS